MKIGTFQVSGNDKRANTFLSGVITAGYSETGWRFRGTAEEILAVAGALRKMKDLPEGSRIRHGRLEYIVSEQIPENPPKCDIYMPGHAWAAAASKFAEVALGWEESPFDFNTCGYLPQKLKWDLGVEVQSKLFVNWYERRILAESEHYVVASEAESVYLIPKYGPISGNREEILIGDFYNNPVAALIDQTEQWVITIGYGLILYHLHEPFQEYQYHTATEQWFELHRDPDDGWWLQAVYQRYGEVYLVYGSDIYRLEPATQSITKCR
jgi:hypothetical protein